MAFTEEQEKAILDFVAAGTKAPPATPPADAAPAAGSTPPEGDKPDDKTKTIAQEAKEEIEAKKAAEGALSQIQASVKFNLGINEFVEKNKSLLPEEAETILKTASTKTFKDDNERANIVRKGLLDSFLSQQENLDSLTGSLKDRAAKYSALAESEKEKRSSEFWDLAEIGIALKAGSKKAEALNKINGVNAGDATGSILEQKILAAANNKFNNNQ